MHGDAETLLGKMAKLGSLKHAVGFSNYLIYASASDITICMAIKPERKRNKLLSSKFTLYTIFTTKFTKDKVLLSLCATKAIQNETTWLNQCYE